MSKETVYRDKDGKLFRIMTFPKDVSGAAYVVYQGIEDGAAHVMPEQEFFDGRMTIYRRALPKIRLRIPQAALENAMHEYWFHATQGESTLDENPVETVEEVRALVEAILNRACDGAMVLVET